jgi:hypothetical protein
MRNSSTQPSLSLTLEDKMSYNSNCYQPVSDKTAEVIEERLTAGARGETNIRHIPCGESEPNEGDH